MASIQELNELVAELLKLRETYDAELAEIDARCAGLRKLAEAFHRQSDVAVDLAKSLAAAQSNDPADFWKRGQS